MSQSILARTGSVMILSFASVLGACGGGGGSGGFNGIGALGGANDGPGSTNVPPVASSLQCDDSIKTSFKPDANTSVLLVRQFKQNDPLLLSGAATASTPKAGSDLCFVKLLVGPGNSGPAGAPSTSAGIGIEVWLPNPSAWNERIRAYGNGGWAGTAETSLTQISTSGDGVAVNAAAASKGFVVATSDNGHVGGPLLGSFAMSPDGTLNTTLLNDFTERSLHELAEKTKALTKAFYGKAYKYAYWDGYSSGGMQGLKYAQKFPQEWDGILAGAPAINWTRFLTAGLYPQIVMKTDLGQPIAPPKLDAVTTSAINFCGGARLGFLLDPLACRYDPEKDAAALCAGIAGAGGVVGTNSSSTTCVSLAEAKAINKIWYGQTPDGTAPDPAVDNASGPNPTGKQLWFGVPRGASLSGGLALAGSSPFPVASDTVALILQDSTIAGPSFVNATGNGANRWNTLSFSDLADVYARGLTLQPQFANINADNPDLSAFQARKGKLILYHGMADQIIMPRGSINYYDRVIGATGGLSKAQGFFRFYEVPGLTHTLALSGPKSVPLPQTSLGRDEMFLALQKWVEDGVAPDRIDVSSPDSNVSLPLCVYPQKVTYIGNGLETVASSYICK